MVEADGVVPAAGAKDLLWPPRPAPRPRLGAAVAAVGAVLAEVAVPAPDVDEEVEKRPPALVPEVAAGAAAVLDAPRADPKRGADVDGIVAPAEVVGVVPELLPKRLGLAAAGVELCALDLEPKRLDAVDEAGAWVVAAGAVPGN
jgi:hypothetical protein